MICTISGYDNETLSIDMNILPISPPTFAMNVKPGHRACNNSDMIVPTSDRNIKEKRLFCIYCKKTISVLHRHLTTVHKDEKEVKQLIDLPKRNFICILSSELLPSLSSEISE